MGNKKKMSRGALLELLVVILLGVTALLTAWASWVGSLHGGNQATNYTRSNNIASEGNSEYNAAVQSLTQDMMLYNEVNVLMIDQAFAENRGDKDELGKISWKIDELISANMSEELSVAFDWAMEQTEARGESVSPFEKEGFVESYFETANALLAESEEILEQGKQDNKNGDTFGLVTVIYSMVLFLLGITGTFKNEKNKIAVLCISGAAFLIATIFMMTIPMPTGFSLSSFFGGN
ncbi:MAG: hypothetical protein LBT19_01405 [Candidatus Nomurabacteria bacterium]|jgi:hypothetical protein|nr:hypothetical protein [Candidatus Nomurabacteria bacterium]